jgi:hypothetical protein
MAIKICTDRQQTAVSELNFGSVHRALSKPHVRGVRRAIGERDNVEVDFRPDGQVDIQRRVEIQWATNVSRVEAVQRHQRLNAAPGGNASPDVGITDLWKW